MSRSRALQYYILARLLLAPLMLWTQYNARVLLRATPGVDAVLGNRAPIVSRGVSRTVRAIKTFAVAVPQLFGIPTAAGFGEFNYRPGSRRLVSDQQYFPATVELAAFSMAVALIIELALVCFPHRDQARFSI